MQTKNLKALSNVRLLERIEELARRERRITVAIIDHLAELDARHAYRQLSYASLWDYCRTHLKYSESAACRRLRAARCLRRFPQI